MWHVWRVWHKNMCHMPHVSHAILISCSNGLAFLGLRFKSLIPCLKSGIQPELYWLFYLFSITEAVSKLRVTHVTSHLVTRNPFVFWPIEWAHSFLLRENNNLIETGQDQCHRSILKQIKECSYSSFGKRDVCDVQFAKFLSFQKFIWNDHGCGRQF